jgi:hypothetical protein
METKSLWFNPIWTYLAAGFVAFVCWYGWTYEIVRYARDLQHQGPLAYVAGYLSMPITKGVNFLPPQNPLTSALLVWFLWFVVFRLGLAAYTKRISRTTKPQ